MTMTDNSAVLDRAKAVRAGEELPLETLQPWLEHHLHLMGTPEVTQYSGGASNWTYCLRYPEQSVILRRAPAGTKAKGAHDMGREYHLQQALQSAYPLVPDMLGHCDNDAVIGTEFYVMQKLDGIIPRKNMPRGLNLTNDQTQTLCYNAINSLIALHQVDVEAAGLSHIAKGKGYVERQISGWCGRYTKAKTWNVPSAKGIMAWLQANIPPDETICMTHNDFRFDNLVLAPDDPTQIIGVLDWELATLGDPLMDLGNSLAYWVQADDDFVAQGTRRQPTHLEGMLTRAEVVKYYAQKTGMNVSNMAFYEVYGLFRLAAIVLQIYYRYHHKQTRNPAFKHLWFFTQYLLHRCRKIIKTAG
jgi:aminoglycoside phosphotransferase (APT) family kinase protein